MNFTEDFRQALGDYSELLNKKYPQKSILELVSTRYSLNHFERSMLYRGVSESRLAGNRKNRLVGADRIPGSTLHIDLFNALFTMAAYLRGFPVYLSYDGLLRDASENHGNEDWGDHLHKANELTIAFLENRKPGKAFFYIDIPVERSVLVVEKVHGHFAKSDVSYAIELHESPDQLLEKATTGLLASSDSTIIDRATLPVFDLPRAVLEFHFNPDFLSLKDLITKH